MSLQDIASNLTEIRDAYAENFMGDRCNVWTLRKYAEDNDGAQVDYGDSAALSDVPCNLRQPQSDRLDLGGLVDLKGSIALPIAHLGAIRQNDRIEITTIKTETLPASIWLVIMDAPRPESIGLVCKVEMVRGGSNK